jgi:glutathione peroxidase-family protein
VTVNFTNTHTFTPVPTATETQISESEAFEIKEIKIYPIPYNCNEFLNVKFNITQECKKISIKIYTVGFRLVKNIERDGINNKGTIEIKIDNKYFKNMGNGVYYFVISGTNTEGKYIRGKPETIILLKK